jgi:uncharacterized protein (TIGR03086 family)
MTSDLDLLESVLTKTEALVRGVGAEQMLLRTPCPDLDVEHLVDHVVGWVREFARRATSESAGESAAEDPGSYRAGTQAAAQLDDASRRLVAGLRGSPSPAVPPGMLLMEFIGHGWDLAVATGQPLTFTDEEAQAALTTGEQLLKPEYRGPGKSFGPQVTPPDDASALERLVAFLGREPRWDPSTS